MAGENGAFLILSGFVRNYANSNFSKIFVRPAHRLANSGSITISLWPLTGPATG
jgi:hypothetical protein